MDTNLIASNATRIWQIMNNGTTWRYEKLKLVTGFSDREINAAIGWLAREDLLPTHVSCQSGGGMGTVSVGTGWEYGSHRRWETDFFIGLVPKYDSSSAKVSFALKENFIPWHIQIKRNFSVEPLTASLYFTTLISDKVWTHLPEKYSHGYYNLPTKIRADISLGQRLKWYLPHKRGRVESISAYYEISTCDIYVLSAAGNSEIKFHELLQLCIGVRINFNR